MSGGWNGRLRRQAGDHGEAERRDPKRARTRSDPPQMIGKLARAIAGTVLTLLVGGLLAAMMVRHAPGFGADEILLDGRISAEAIREMQNAALRESALGFYWRYLRGEMGVSQAYR